jgi:hypothetical protein
MMLWWLACAEPEASPEARVEAAEMATLASVSELGSYVMSSKIVRTWSAVGGDKRKLEEEMTLRWEDADRWSLRWLRDGRQTQRVVLFGGSPWVATGDGALSRKSDPEPYRVQLASAWDPWDLALDQVHRQVGLSFLRPDVYEGRPVRVFSTTLLPLPPKSHASWTATAIAGEVWLDEATSVRLKVDLTLSAQGKRETLDLEFMMAVAGIGQPADVADPQIEEGSVADPPRRLEEAPPRPERPR